VDEALSYARIARAGVLDPTAVRAVVNAHLENRADRGRTLWTLLSLQMWAERWLLGSDLAVELSGRREPAAVPEAGAAPVAAPAPSPTPKPVGARK
jgi:hypothetical protein